MKYRPIILCCLCVAFLSGCGKEEDTSSNAPLASGGNAETPMATPDAGEDGKNSPAETTVYRHAARAIKWAVAGFVVPYMAVPDARFAAEQVDFRRMDI